MPSFSCGLGVIFLKVKILKSIASNDFSHQPGKIINVDDDLAKKWVKSGIAEKMDEPKKKKGDK
jgi:hypothetical protein